MGDSGALFCGFTLGAIAVTGVLKTKVVVMLLPIFVLSVPLLDITYSTLRRLLKGQNPFIADADHIHHHMLRAGYTQIRTVVFFYAICVLGGLIATGYLATSYYTNYLVVYVALIAGITLLATLLILLVRRFYTPSEAPPENNPSETVP